MYQTYAATPRVEESVSDEDLAKRPRHDIANLPFPTKSQYLYEPTGKYHILSQGPYPEKDQSIRPTVFFNANTLAKIKYIVNKCDKEVAWLMPTMKMNSQSPHYLIYGAFLFWQEVTGVEVSPDGKEIKRAFEDLAGTYPDCFKGQTQNVSHGHSHVNMGVSPSGTDNQQRTKRDRLGWDAPYRIFCIFNKKGDIRADLVQYYPVFHKFEQIDVGISYEPLTEEIDYTKRAATQHLDEQIATFVHAPTPLQRSLTVSRPNAWYNQDFDNQTDWWTKVQYGYAYTDTPGPSDADVMDTVNAIKDLVISLADRVPNHFLPTDAPDYFTPSDWDIESELRVLGMPARLLKEFVTNTDIDKFKDAVAIITQLICDTIQDTDDFTYGLSHYIANAEDMVVCAAMLDWVSSSLDDASLCLTASNPEDLRTAITGLLASAGLI